MEVLTRGVCSQPCFSSVISGKGWVDDILLLALCFPCFLVLCLLHDKYAACLPCPCGHWLGCLNTGILLLSESLSTENLSTAVPAEMNLQVIMN